MNIALLERVRDYIERNPEKNDQSAWCGSECCVAGTTALLVRAVSRKEMVEGNVDQDDVMVAATRALDLTCDQRDRLFSATWYAVAAGQFRVVAEMSPGDRARIAVARINHFIATGGAE